MAEIEDLNVTDASNTGRFPENQAPSTVNDGARALEGLLARFHEDLGARKASTGSANAYVFAAAQTLGAYYDGLLIGFDANFANTGAATINVDGLGAKTIKKHNDQDLASGDIESGQKVLLVYDGTNFQLLSPLATAPAAATQAEQETGTAVDIFVTPGRQQFHASAAKAWLNGNASGGINGSYNITSVTDTGTGDILVTIATDFSSTGYAVIGTALTAAGSLQVCIETQAAGTFSGYCSNNSDTKVDPSSWFFAAFGDQA